MAEGLRAWADHPSFAQALETYLEGERDLVTPELVQAYVEAAAFDVGAETDRWAAEIVATFFRQLRRALLQSEYGPEVQAQRLEVMHAEIREDYRVQAVQISSVATQMAQLLALARDGSRSGLPEEEKANVVLDQARMLIRSGRHLAARSLVQEVRRTLPADASPALRARVALNLGACHMYAGDTATAEAEFHAALRSQPDDPKPLINLAVARLVSGDGAGALERSRRARELAPDDADAAAVYLEALHATGQDVMLETTLQEHASLRTSAHVLASLGLIRQDQGRHAEAEDLYREAERLDPRTRACRPIGPARSWPKSSRRWKQTRRHSRGAWTRACESGCSRPNNS